MPEREPRNLVICCDGTSNEIGVLLSNVLKLYRLSEKSERQLAFYQPGIGTPQGQGRAGNAQPQGPELSFFKPAVSAKTRAIVEQMQRSSKVIC